jgi:hypothetical protein
MVLELDLCEGISGIPVGKVAEPGEAVGDANSTLNNDPPESRRRGCGSSWLPRPSPRRHHLCWLATNKPKAMGIMGSIETLALP